MRLKIDLILEMMKMKIINFHKLFFSVLFLILFIGCSENNQSTNNKKLSIFVASSAKYAIEDITKEFKKEIDDEVEIEIYSNSSGKGFAQLQNGFKYDLYFSADSIYPKKIIENNLAKESKVYAKGLLVLYSKNSDLLKNNNLVEILTNQNISKIAVANPKLAPYGVLGIKLLKNLNLENKLKSKLVFGSNIAQTVQFVDSGNAEIGLVAKSLVKDKKFLSIDKKLFKPISQSFVLTKFGENKSLAVKFRDFVLSKKAQLIIQSYGFEPAIKL